jgi:hypothetical protein
MELVTLEVFAGFLYSVFIDESVTVAERSKGRTVFARSDAVYVGSNPT